MNVWAEHTNAAQALRPVVYVEGDKYCCLLGPNPRDGVFGCGNTPDEALNNWEQHLKDRLQNPGEDDYIVNYVMHVISERKEDFSEDIRDFYDQSRHVT